MSLQNGGFAVAFQSEHQDGDGIGVFLKFYDGSGQETSDEILVNTTVQGNQLFTGSSSVKSLDILPTGELVVVWQSDASGNYDIYAQKFNQNGTKIGDEYLVNSVQEGEQVSGNIAVSHSGDVGIVWENQSLENDTVQVKAKFFDKNDTVNPEASYSSEIIAPNQGDGVSSDDDSIVAYTVDFSEPVSGITAGDIRVEGGAVVAETVDLSEDGLQATFDVQASDDSIADLVVTVRTALPT